MSLFGSQDKEKPKQITAVHVLAAQALAAGKTNETAAQEAGVTERTLYNWQKDSWFRRLIEDSVQMEVAKAKMALPDCTILDKRNRLIGMQEQFERLKALKPGKASEEVQTAKAIVDILQAVSKELGEEGQPLHGKDEASGLPVVLNLDHPGVIKEVPKDGSP